MPSVRQRQRTSGRNVVKARPKAPRVLHLLDVVDYDEVGEAITVGDRVIESVRRNLGVTEAANAAGVQASTAQGWLRDGAKLSAERIAAAEGVGSYRRLSQRDKALLWFYDGITTARAEAEQRLVIALDALATGEGLQTGQVVRKIEVSVGPDGKRIENEVERRVTQSPVLPNVEALKFVLKAKAPERWGNTDTLEVVGGGGGPVEHHHTHSMPALEDLVGKLAEKLAGSSRRQVIDVEPLGPGSQPQLAEGDEA